MITRRLGRSPDFEGERTFVEIWNLKLKGRTVGWKGEPREGTLSPTLPGRAFRQVCVAPISFGRLTRLRMPSGDHINSNLTNYNTIQQVLFCFNIFVFFSANMINIFEINLGNNKVALNAYKWLWVSKQKNCIVIVLCCHCQSPRYSQLLQPSNDFVGIFWNCGQMFVSL